MKQLILFMGPNDRWYKKIINIKVKCLKMVALIEIGNNYMSQNKVPVTYS